MYVKLAFSANFDVTLLCCDCLFCHNILLFSSFLLVSNGFFAAFACTGIVLCALTTHGQPIAMADAAVAADIHQTLDVELDGRAAFAFDFDAHVGNRRTDCADLVVRPVLYFEVVAMPAASRILRAVERPIP